MKPDRGESAACAPASSRGWIAGANARRFARRSRPHDRSPPPCAWLGWGVAAHGVGVAVLLLVRQPLSDWLWPETRAQQLRAEAARRWRGQTDRGRRPRRARTVRGRARARSRSQRCARRSGAGRPGGDGASAACDWSNGVTPTRTARSRSRANWRCRRAQADARRDGIARREGGRCRHRAPVAAGRRARVRPASSTATTPARWPLYQRVLALQPSHTQALEGREDTLADLLQQAQQALARRRTGEPRPRSSTACRPPMPATSTCPVRSPSSAQASRTAPPPGRRRPASRRLPSALEGYRAVLVADPGDADATRGLGRVGDRLCRAQRASRRGFPFRRGRWPRCARPRRSARRCPPSPKPAPHLARARQSQSRYGSSCRRAERQRGCGSCCSRPPPPRRAATCSRRRATARSTSCARRARSRRRIRACSARRRGCCRRRKACFENGTARQPPDRARECLDARRVLEGESAGAGARIAGDGSRSAGSRSATSAWAPAKCSAAQVALAAARALDPAPPAWTNSPNGCAPPPRPTDRARRPVASRRAAAPGARRRGRHRARNAAATLSSPLSASRCHSAASSIQAHHRVGEAGGVVGDQHVLAIAQVHALDRAGGGHHRLAVRHAQVDLALDAGAVTQRRHRDPRAVHVRRQVRHVAVDLDARLAGQAPRSPAARRRRCSGSARPAVARGSSGRPRRRTSAPRRRWAGAGSRRRTPGRGAASNAGSRARPPGAGWTARRRCACGASRASRSRSTSLTTSVASLRAMRSSSSARVRSAARASAASPASSAPRCSRR